MTKALYTMIDTEHRSLESFLKQIHNPEEYNGHDYRISTMEVNTLIKVRSERDRYKIIKLHVKDEVDMPLKMSDIKKAEAIQNPAPLLTSLAS